MSHPRSYLIVGSGVFGASTALELVKQKNDVVVLDRSNDGYASPDAASNDINKIIRSDYTSKEYASLARKAIQTWKKDTLLAPYYHEVGFILQSRFNPEQAKAYVDKSISGFTAQNSTSKEALGRNNIQPLLRKDDVAALFPNLSSSQLGYSLQNLGESTYGFINPNGGWSEANAATRSVLDEAIKRGAKTYGNAEVESLVFEQTSPRVKGVRTLDGRTFLADVVILAPGAWLTLLLDKLLHNESKATVPLEKPATATAQPVLTIQLTNEEYKRYENNPVVMDSITGLYVFPPNAESKVKFAIHCPGFLFPAPEAGSSATTLGVQPPSLPSCNVKPSTTDRLPTIYEVPLQPENTMPNDIEHRMRCMLMDIYPELAMKAVTERRVCWYSDTSSNDENWLIDWHPRIPGLFVAGAGSGHAFKVS